MKRRSLLPRVLLLSAALAVAAQFAGMAQARPVALGGVLTTPRIETKPLTGPSGTVTEGLPVWFLPRLGIQVRPGGGLTLAYGGRSLTFVAGRWMAQGFAGVPATLPVPETYNGSLHVPLSILTLLGVQTLADTPEVLDFAVATTPGAASGVVLGGIPAVPPSAVPVTQPPVVQPPNVQPVTQPPALQPSVALPVPQLPVIQSPVAQPPVVQPPVTPAPVPVAALLSVRSSRSLDRNIELQRVVLEFSAAAPYTVSRDRNGLSFELPGVSSGPQTQQLESGDDLGVSLGTACNPGAAGTTVRLDTRGGVSEVFTLQNPYRIVIDTTTNIDTSVPPPVEAATLPDGVTLRRLGGLSLLTFDARYAPRVVTAPLGHASGVADLVKSLGGVAGVNGGYFDPASALPVDLVALGGLMVSPSLEKRATLGLDAQGVPRLGYPRPRYVLSGAAMTLTVNSVSARPNPQWVTAFVGDGRTAVGGDTLTTLILQGGLGSSAGTVSRALTGRFVPAAGEFAVTFDPARYPQLAVPTGSPLSYSLNWQAPGWDGTQEALAAGPLLVSAGKLALDPGREGFDTSGSIWRATRQVAFVTLEGRSGIAFLDNGTPGDFARALLSAGVSGAMRLDSGSSATVYVTGGYLNAGGYLNTVWSRSVPNALVFVPKVGAQSK
ncbi:phosphodiester glycosidase family protein [Deinococcus radiomollis]|uniref:phosphodiester glycosidase family protein n=1 Tax=Deinococcus radiomollis TaxID=468916 RepID=UPI0038914F9E